MENVRIRWCETESDFQALENLSTFRRQSSTGELQGCLAERNGRNVGGFWAATKQFDESELGIRFVLDANQAWLFASKADDLRSAKDMYPKILAFVVAELSKQGRNQPLVAVNANDDIGQKFHQQHSLISPGWVLAGRTLRTACCLVGGEIDRDRAIAWNSTTQPIELRIGSASAIEGLGYAGEG